MQGSRVRREGQVRPRRELNREDEEELLTSICPHVAYRTGTAPVLWMAGMNTYTPHTRKHTDEGMFESVGGASWGNDG